MTADGKTRLSWTLRGVQFAAAVVGVIAHFEGYEVIKWIGLGVCLAATLSVYAVRLFVPVDPGNPDSESR